MATGKKKASPAQIAARKLFAQRAKAGAFKRKATKNPKRGGGFGPFRGGEDLGYFRAKSKGHRRAAKRLYKKGDIAGAKYHASKIGVTQALGWPKKRNKSKSPSPAQLAARTKFVAMVRAKAKGKKVNRRGKKNPGVLKFKSEADFAKYKGKIRTSAPKKRATTARKATSRKRGKTPSRSLFRAFRVGRAVGRGVKSTYRGARSVGRGLWFGLKNPAGQHLAGAVPAKYQRMYEHVLQSSGSKSIAAATTRAEMKRQNPSLFKRTFAVYGHKTSKRTGLARGKSKKLGAVKAFTSWGAHRKAKRIGKKMGFSAAAGRYGLSKKQRKGFSLLNPAPAKVFTEFRGKDVQRKTKVKAANGTPSTLAQLGKLRELRLRGKTLRFKAGHLAADGRKKLHIVGIKAKYRGNPASEVDVGEIISVTYEADKPHVETGVFNYVHKFGEDGGVRPHLVVDPEGYMKIEGGSYKISADGIID